MISYNYICLLGITKSQGIKKVHPSFVLLAPPHMKHALKHTVLQSWPCMISQLTMTLLVYILPSPVLRLLQNMCKEQHLTSIISFRRELKPTVKCPVFLRSIKNFG